VSDRIALGIETDGSVAEAFAAHREYIAGETLATQIVEGALPGAAFLQQTELDGLSLVFGVRRV
jgi:hypothetical protein